MHLDRQQGGHLGNGTNDCTKTEKSKACSGLCGSLGKRKVMRSQLWAFPACFKLYAKETTGNQWKLRTCSIVKVSKS